MWCKKVDLIFGLLAIKSYHLEEPLEFYCGFYGIIFGHFYWPEEANLFTDF